MSSKLMASLHQMSAAGCSNMSLANSTTSEIMTARNLGIKLMHALYGVKTMAPAYMPKLFIISPCAQHNRPTAERKLSAAS